MSWFLMVWKYEIIILKDATIIYLKMLMTQKKKNLQRSLQK